jgi:hypothetical protein
MKLLSASAAFAPLQQAIRLSLSGILREPSRQENQRGPGGSIVDCKEGLQEIKTVAGNGVLHRGERGRLTRSDDRSGAGSVAAGRLQLHDIGRIATLEGPLSLDLARHNAFPMQKITGKSWVNFRG